MSPYGYPHPGGVNHHVRNQYEQLTALGHDAWIITSKYGQVAGRTRAASSASAPATRSRPTAAWAASPSGWQFKEQARELLVSEHRFDVLHFHGPFVPFYSPTVLDPVTDTINVATFHAFGGFSPSPTGSAKWVRRRASPPKLHGRIAVAAAQRATSSAAISPATIEIIPNGVDLDLYADAEPFDGLRDGTINILFVGRFEERKGLIHLLRAYHRLRKRHVDARLLVIGSGPKAREYRRFVGLRQIRDVEFLDG